MVQPLQQPTIPIDNLSVITPTLRQRFRLAPTQPTLEIADHIAKNKHMVSSHLYKPAAATQLIARDWDELYQQLGLDEQN